MAGRKEQSSIEIILSVSKDTLNFHSLFHLVEGLSGSAEQEERGPFSEFVLEASREIRVGLVRQAGAKVGVQLFIWKVIQLINNKARINCVLRIHNCTPTFAPPCIWGDWNNIRPKKIKTERIIKTVNYMLYKGTVLSLNSIRPHTLNNITSEYIKQNT